MKKASHRSNYYHAICNFQRYFQKYDNKKDFIKDLKENLKFYQEAKKNKEIKTDGHYLHLNTNSYIYYPNEPKNLEKNTKNVLLVIHELSRTGAPVVCLDTAKSLVKNGYFVTVISVKSGPLLNELLQVGIPVVIMRELFYFQHSGQDISNFTDVIDFDEFIKYFDITIMITAVLCKLIKRYIYTEHKIIWWLHEGSVSYDILDYSMPKEISSNIRVICGGQYALDQLKERGYQYNASVLNYGVEDQYRGTNKKKSHDKITFLLAGTLGIRKGQAILLEAIKKLELSIREQATFLFIGDGCMQDINVKIIKQKLEEYANTHDNVQMMPSVSREELYRIYDEIDVLVLASIDDPMPVVATENLMLKNICLCSTKTGTSYYIEDKVSGFVFESENVEDLAEKITYIIENKQRLNEIAENGRKIYETYFEMSIFEKKILQLVSGEE